MSKDGTSVLQERTRVNFFNLFNQRRGMELEDHLLHLARQLPHGGLVELTGKFDPKQKAVFVGVYTPASGSYEEADFDVNLGQPLPNGNVIDITRYRPISQLEGIAYSGYNQGGPLNLAGFANAWYEFLLSDNGAFARGADLVEVGKIIGDPHNRFIPVKLYRNRKL